MAKIQLNGRKLELKNRYSIFTLLKKYKLESKKIAVELNGKIINSNKHKTVFVKNRDKIEIVHFIGGG
ncbi:sulfur carrier protein ThiS [Pelagibacteraceae bacterium]|jgi:sulfur carrier protein|nr:sulfur carrier protein ThiS [Pelagibacteraceae bacterium]